MQALNECEDERLICLEFSDKLIFQRTKDIPQYYKGAKLVFINSSAKMIFYRKNTDGNRDR